MEKIRSFSYFSFVELPLRENIKTRYYWIYNVKGTKLTDMNVLGLPRWFSGKESDCQYRKLKRHGFNFWIGKSLWRREWQPLQYSCLENPTGREVCWATVHGVTKSPTHWVSEHTHVKTESLPTIMSFTRISLGSLRTVAHPSHNEK